MIVVSAASVLSNVAQQQLLSGSYSQAEAVTNDNRQQLLGVAYFVTLLITIVVFCVWIHRAAVNVRALGAEGLVFTPGWCVRWYFVPIANLWKPFQAMREIWKGSKNPSGWRTEATNPLLGWWWAGWIISNVLDQAYFRTSSGAHSVSALSAATSVGIVSDLADIIADALALVLVTSVCRLQVSAYDRRLGNSVLAA
jgi:hypothetical protein